MQTGAERLGGVTPQNLCCSKQENEWGRRRDSDGRTDDLKLTSVEVLCVDLSTLEAAPAATSRHVVGHGPGVRHGGVYDALSSLLVD